MRMAEQYKGTTDSIYIENKVGGVRFNSLMPSINGTMGKVEHKNKFDVGAWPLRICRELGEYLASIEMIDDLQQHSNVEQGRVFEITQHSHVYYDRGWRIGIDAGQRASTTIDIGKCICRPFSSAVGLGKGLDKSQGSYAWEVWLWKSDRQRGP